MSVTNFITRSYRDTGETIQNQESPAGNWQTIFDQFVPPGIDIHYDVDIKRSELAAMAMFSDIGCIVGTNGTVFSSPPTNHDEWTLNPASVYVWTLAQDTLTPGPGLVSCPITADVTGIYVTNGNAASPPLSARLKIKVLRNA